MIGCSWGSLRSNLEETSLLKKRNHYQWEWGKSNLRSWERIPRGISWKCVHNVGQILDWAIPLGSANHWVNLMWELGFNKIEWDVGKRTCGPAHTVKCLCWSKVGKWWAGLGSWHPLILKHRAVSSLKRDDSHIFLDLWVSFPKHRIPTQAPDHRL